MGDNDKNDILHSKYIAVQYNKVLHRIQHNNFEGENSVRLPTHEIYPYLALIGELWMYFMSYSEKSDRELSSVHCIEFAMVTVQRYAHDVIT